jgi:hypothetical protein
VWRVDVAEVLLDRWELKPERLEVLTGGMNSAAWLATTDDSVQAAYFAWRCANDIRTGIADPAENRKGLADAHQAFASV